VKSDRKIVICLRPQYNFSDSTKSQLFKTLKSIALTTYEYMCYKLKKITTA